MSLVDGLKYSLGKNGFDVTVVRTVEKALESLSIISEYDLLLLDVTLPDGTGFDVCEKVRRQNRQIRGYNHREIVLSLLRSSLDVPPLFYCFFQKIHFSSIV